MFPNYQNIVSDTNITNTAANVNATFAIASDNNRKPSVSTPLLNDPSSFSHESNNNIVWLLARLEKRIDQMEKHRNQKIFASNNLSQNNIFDNGHYHYNSNISNEDIYNLLSKLFIRVERLEINVERNLAELNKTLSK
nr:9693_t:CDS:1 [Entrophospora candida]